MAHALTKTVLVASAVLACAFGGYVQSRPADFRYERSGVIQATPEVIFPYLNDFRRGNEWSPYSRKDPHMAFTFAGPAAGVGAQMAFSGNRDVGAGSLEILRSEPNASVDVRLTMREPFEGENLVRYVLVPEGSGTRFTWTMTGTGGFLSKLVSVLIDCDKMVAGDFAVGIQNLKVLIESTPR